MVMICTEEATSVLVPHHHSRVVDKGIGGLMGEVYETLDSLFGEDALRGVHDAEVSETIGKGDDARRLITHDMFIHRHTGMFVEYRTSDIKYVDGRVESLTERVDVHSPIVARSIPVGRKESLSEYLDVCRADLKPYFKGMI